MFPFEWFMLQFERLVPPFERFMSLYEQIPMVVRMDSNGHSNGLLKKQTFYAVVRTVCLVVRTAIEQFANDFFEPFAKAFRYVFPELVTNTKTWSSRFSLFIWRINLSRTIEYFKIWQRLLNIVPADIAVNVLIGCLCIGMRYYIYIQGVPKKSDTIEIISLFSNRS